MIRNLRSRFKPSLSGPWPAAFLLLIALGLAVQGARVLYGSTYTGPGWLWYLAAAVLAAAALLDLARREPEAVPPARPAPFARPARIGLALLLLLAGLVLAALTVANLAKRNNHQEMRWLWLASLGLLLAGSVALGGLGPQFRVQNSEFRVQSSEGRLLLLELAGFLLLIVLAVWLRIDRLREMPPGIFVDETNAALDAIRILEGRPDSPFGTGWFETPTMYAFFLVGLFKLLGTTFVALKAASLIPAILTVAALYPLARLLFGVPTAFAATFILASNRWHMTMSRWGWNEVAPPLFMIGALYFLLRGFRDRRASDFAIGGLLLGLGHYTYLASRLVVLAVVLYLLYRMLLERGFLRRYWRGLALFLLLYAVAFAPLLVTYTQNPFTFSNRSVQVSILHDMQLAYAAGQPAPPGVVSALLQAAGLPEQVSLKPLGESIRSHLQMFHVAGDRNPRHNLPGEPMLDPVTGSLLLLVLGFAVWKALFGLKLEASSFKLQALGDGHRYGLLLLWLTVPLLGGILTRLEEAPQAYRVLPVVGALALLAGDAAVRSARVLASALGSADTKIRARSETGPSGLRGGRRWLRAVPGVSMAGLLLGAGILNYRLFFDVQARDGRVWQAFSPVEAAVANEVAGKMDDHSLYLSPRLYYFSPLRYLTYRSPVQGGGGLERPAYELAEPVYDLPVSDPFGQDALFLLDTYYQDIPELFKYYYPGTTFEMVDGPGGQPLYLSVTVPGAEVSALQGLQGQYTLAPGQQPVVRSYAGAPLFLWPSDLAGQDGPDALAQWVGSLKAPSSGEYQFQVDGPGRLWLDGQIWSGPRFLGKGLYTAAVEQTEPSSDVQITLSWTQPRGADAEPVPPHFFFQAEPPLNGLLAEYFRGELWEGQPVFSRVDPLLLFAWPEEEPWAAPFSVRWTGTLTAPVGGSYRFQLHADDGVRLWLDGQLAGESVNPDTVNLIDVQVPLTGGPHDVRIDYFQRGGGKALEFWWQPPGDTLRPVPPGVLMP